MKTWEEMIERATGMPIGAAVSEDADQLLRAALADQPRIEVDIDSFGAFYSDPSYDPVFGGRFICLVGFDREPLPGRYWLVPIPKEDE